MRMSTVGVNRLQLKRRSARLPLKAHEPSLARTACRADRDDWPVRVQSFTARCFHCYRPRLVDLRRRWVSYCRGDWSSGTC